MLKRILAVLKESLRRIHVGIEMRSEYYSLNALVYGPSDHLKGHVGTFTAVVYPREHVTMYVKHLVSVGSLLARSGITVLILLAVTVFILLGFGSRSVIYKSDYLGSYHLALS